MTKIDYVVKTKNGSGIMTFDTDDEAISWATKRREIHGDRVAEVLVVRRETTVTEEVLRNV